MSGCEYSVHYSLLLMMKQPFHPDSDRAVMCGRHALHRRCWWAEISVPRVPRCEGVANALVTPTRRRKHDDDDEVPSTPALQMPTRTHTS